MARSDLLISLVRAAAAGDQGLLRSTVEALAAEERAKQHTVLANKLMKTLSDFSSVPKSVASIPTDGFQRGRDFIAEILPRKTLSDLVLSDEVILACNALIEEQRRADLLRSYSLEPRSKVLLVGPPGNGKTSLAEAIAEALGLPLLVVRYEAMIGSYLGETASRLKKVFDYAKTTPCVLFFDEFDAVGKERGDTHETGEIKRVVTSLLMQIDELPSYTLVVAATNHAELLDRAVWRRFQIRLNLDAPSVTELAKYIKRFLENLQKPIGVSPESIARALGSVSYSEAEQFCLNVMRRFVLSLGEASAKSVIKEELGMWSAQMGIKKSVREGSRASTSAAKTARARKN